MAVSESSVHLRLIGLKIWAKCEQVHVGENTWYIIPRTCVGASDMRISVC